MEQHSTATNVNMRGVTMCPAHLIRSMRDDRAVQPCLEDVEKVGLLGKVLWRLRRLCVALLGVIAPHDKHRR